MIDPNFPAEGNARMDYLDRLYQMDGRHYPKHPLHGRYTGLYQDRVKAMMAFDRKLQNYLKVKLASAVADLSA